MQRSINGFKIEKGVKFLCLKNIFYLLDKKVEVLAVKEFPSRNNYHYNLNYENN